MSELRDDKQQGRGLLRPAGRHRAEHEHNALPAVFQQHGDAVQRQQVQM